MEELRLSFALDWPWWLVLPATGLGLLAVILFYRRVSSTVPKRYLALLVGLRTAAMIALCLCLFRPVIAYERGAIERSHLVFLVDTSRSMSVHDFPGQPSRFERVSNVLLERGGMVSRLEKHFTLHWHAFDEHAQPLKDRAGLGILTPNGDGTDPLASAKDALVDVDKGDVGGVILLTDGVITTEARPAQFVGMGVPIYAVGVGSALRTQKGFRDIAIDGVEVKREVTVKITTPVEILVEAVGYADRVVPIVLSENDVEVARERLVLDNARGPQKVTLNYVPQSKGDFELTVSIPSDADERITENNRATVPVFVGDPKIRVLYIEGVARNEYRQVRRVLQFDPNIEVLFLVQIAPNVFLQQGNVTDVKLNGPPTTREELSQFKVLVIGSLDASLLTREQMELIRAFVTDGGGLLMLGGNSSFGPGGYGGTPVDEVLPVVCGGRNIGQERDPFILTLTSAGRAHPIFAGITEFFGGVDGETKVPPLLGCTRVERAKPAAEVLAINPNRRNAAGPLVAVAVTRYGSGRSMAATIDTTHLWYVPLKGMGKASPYVRYWGQAMRWLASSEDFRHAAGPGVVAYTDRHFYDPGAEPLIRAFVTDGEGQATDEANVHLEIIREGADKPTTTSLSLVPGTRNEYETRLLPQEPGKYGMTVRATLNETALGEADLTYFVGEPTREFERLDLDAPALRKIADVTGGLYLPLLSLDQLPDVLRARSGEKVERREIFLWNSPVLFVAFVLLITSEWILRKRRLLS